uniref:Uncharacterized protein n=1 Tax=Opuntia streptacantha TaxID=393608 RepID=A0A7C9A7Z8_OPUST
MVSLVKRSTNVSTSNVVSSSSPELNMTCFTSWTIFCCTIGFLQRQQMNQVIAFAVVSLPASMKLRVMSLTYSSFICSGSFLLASRNLDSMSSFSIECCFSSRSWRFCWISRRTNLSMI